MMRIIRFDRRNNVTSHAAHCNADVSRFQRRGIVDAVADHADRLLLFLGSADELQLILRQTARTHLCDAQLSGNRLCSVGVVAGQKNRRSVLFR